MFIMENPIKMHDLGLPPFMETIGNLHVIPYLYTNMYLYIVNINIHLLKSKTC